MKHDLSTLLPLLRNIVFLALDVDGTLTLGQVVVGEDGNAFKSFSVKDGMSIRQLQKAGCQVGIISHTTKPLSVEHRASMLGIQFCATGSGYKKAEKLHTWCKELNIPLQQVAVMGDDVNDLDMMEIAGLSICPADADGSVRVKANICLASKGGEACVREWAKFYYFPAKQWYE